MRTDPLEHSESHSMLPPPFPFVLLHVFGVISVCFFRELQKLIVIYLELSRRHCTVEHPLILSKDLVSLGIILGVLMLDVKLKVLLISEDFHIIEPTAYLIFLY